MANKRIKKKMGKAAQISSNILVTTSVESDNVKPTTSFTDASDSLSATLPSKERQYIVAVSPARACKGVDEVFSTEDNPDTDLASPTEDCQDDADAFPAEAGSSDVLEVAAVTKGKKKGLHLFQALRFVCLIGFVIFTVLFINEVIIQPYRIKKSIDLSRSLYYDYDNDDIKKDSDEVLSSTIVPTQEPDQSDITADVTSIPEPTVAVVAEVTPAPDPFRDEQGRLLQFERLLEKNEDVKGWIKIEDTNIDYPVLQSGADDPDYYLSRDINKEYSKAGSLYLDYRSSVEDNTKNLVIYGHNMVSTAEKMFRSLLNYKPSKEDNSIEFYQKHPVISFDTIYETGTWKIFSVFITTPDSTADYFFDYRKSTFADASDFLNFIYQVRIRSLIDIDTVDINENDQILMLSTCSYEVDRKDLHYRTVIAARKVRDGESIDVDVDSTIVNEQPLYAYDYYYRYGGKAPKLPATFEEALSDGTISWYKPSN